MRSGKKSIAVLAAVLALVLAVQAFAFTAVKLGTSDAADSVEAGVTRQVMDAKPENKTTVVKVTQSADGSGTSGMTSMKPVTESIAPTDVADTANNVKVLSEEDTKTLTEIAEKKIKDENPLFAGDMGFKVFKLDTSNIRPWNPDPDKIELSMYDSVENILKGRSREDLLYEVLLKCNLPLTLSIEEKKFGENTVYIVGSGMLAICLDKTIPQTIAEEIVKLRDEYAPIVPMQVVFRDNGFTDVAKTNVLQILQQAGFEEKSVQTI